MSDKRILSREEQINRNLYKGLYNNNKTNLKVTLGFCYFGVCAEVFKILYHGKLVTALISTMGTSFFVGTLYYYHKTTPAQLIKFIPRTEDDDDYKASSDKIKEIDEEEEEEEEEEEVVYDEETENQLLLNSIKPSFNYIKYYGFIPYGILGGVIGNVIATCALAIKYDTIVAKEWNNEFYVEIITYICGTTLHNTLVFGAVDLFMKSKWFMFDKKKILSNQIKYNNKSN